MLIEGLLVMANDVVAFRVETACGGVRHVEDRENLCAILNSVR